MNEWHVLCRTCGTTINEELDTKLFEKFNYHLVTLIEDITDMWLENDTSLPEYICVGCKSMLEKIITFRASCLETHEQILAAKRKDVKILRNPDDLTEESSRIDFVDIDLNNQWYEELEEHKPKSDCDIHIPTIESARAEHLKTIKSRNKTKKQKNSQINAKTWICEQCGGEFKGSTYLKLHMLRHTGNKKFECDICQSRYYTQNEMLRHRILHTKARPYSCRFCEKTFRGTSSKAVHERTHTNERPFACQYCEKTFTSTSVRRMHERVHVNNRKYHCEPCDQWFLRSSHLTLHQRTKLHKSKITSKK